MNESYAVDRGSPTKNGMTSHLNAGLVSLLVSNVTVSHLSYAVLPQLQQCWPALGGRGPKGER